MSLDLVKQFPASLWLPGPDGDVGEDVECREQGVGLTEVERHRQQPVGDTRGLRRVASPHQDMAEHEAHGHLLHRMPRGRVAARPALRDLRDLLPPTQVVEDLQPCRGSERVGKRFVARTPESIDPDIQLRQRSTRSLGNGEHERDGVVHDAESTSISALPRQRFAATEVNRPARPPRGIARHLAPGVR